MTPAEHAKRAEDILTAIAQPRPEGHELDAEVLALTIGTAQVHAILSTRREPVPPPPPFGAQVPGSLQRPSADLSHALNLLEAGVDNTECSTDHHGDCQAHSWNEVDATCGNQLARNLLDRLRPGWDQV